MGDPAGHRQGEDAHGRRSIPQPPERDQSLRPDSRRRVRQRLDERTRIDSLQFPLPIRQGAESELADGGIPGQRPQGFVRADAVNLLEREEGGGPDVRGVCRVGRQPREGSSRLGRSAPADDLALASEGGCCVVGRQRLHQPREVGLARVRHLGDLQPWRCNARDEPDLRADVHARLAAPPTRDVQASVGPMSIPVGRGMASITSWEARKLAPAGFKSWR
jgi:hypothetical protein